MKIKNLFPTIIILLLTNLLILVFTFMYSEFRLNLAYATSLNCKAPNFITNADQDKKIKDTLESKYIDKCSGYSTTKNLIFNFNSELNDFINGHWVALEDLFANPDNLKNLITTGIPNSPVISEAASESLWLAIVEIQNKCDPESSPPLKSCTDLIQSMVSNNKLKLYPKNRIAYLRDNFSDESDFIQRLNKYTNKKLTRETCRADWFYLGEKSKVTPCQGIEDSKYSFKEKSGQYYPILTIIPPNKGKSND